MEDQDEEALGMSEAGPIRGMDCAEEIETVEASQLDGRMDRPIEKARGGDLATGGLLNGLVMVKR